MVPPEVSAVTRAPRRACRCRCTASRCRYPARGPSRVLKPSHSMRTTLSNVTRRNPANGHACRTSANSASSSQSSHAASATICCASTSTGASGMRRASTSPRRMDAIQQRGAFDQLVTGLRKQARLRRTANLVPGTPGALQEGGDRAWRTELADQIDIADIQPQLQRCGRHQHSEIAGLEPSLGQQACLARQTAVMRRHAVVTEKIAQMPRHIGRQRYQPTRRRTAPCQPLIQGLHLQHAHAAPGNAARATSARNAAPAECACGSKTSTALRLWGAQGHGTLAACLVSSSS